MKEIKVYAFPIDDYNRDELGKMTNEELLEAAQNDTSVLYCGNLKSFENTLNDEDVLSQDHWIKFVECKNDKRAMAIE